ncbi:MAG: hypothetical protein H6Q74_936 [Firmicutes bacterium]|nr:hypothetical protein [Bacillota bacterium]
MKKTLSTILMFLVVMSLAASVSAHSIDQAQVAPQEQMLAAHDGPPPVDQPPAPAKHHHKKPAPPVPQPNPHF